MANDWTPAQLSARVKQVPGLITELMAGGVKHELDPLLPVAIAYRETKLQDISGDGGHGFGPMQLDNRSHGIPANWKADPTEIIDVCCGILDASIHWVWVNYHDLNAVKIGCAAYNAGFGNVAAGIKDGNCDKFTTGGNYGADVLNILAELRKLGV